MLIACLSLVLLTVALGIVLGWAARRFAVEADPLTEKVLEALPGTQCGQCGFAGCSQLAEKLVSGEVRPDVCSPGGAALLRELAPLLGLEATDEDDGPRTATVNFDLCIGCTKCFRACPTDAVVGAPKQMHFVLEEHCTACGLCVDACPTECMTLETPRPSIDSWRWPRPEAA